MPDPSADSTIPPDPDASVEEAASAGPLAIGQVIERYTVEATLGSGAMATVYRVRHNTLGVQRALKVLTRLGSNIRERMV